MKATTLPELLVWLSNQRLDAAVEKKAQGQLEAALKECGYSFVREKRLSDRDIVDFYLEIGNYNVALELKAKAQRMKIYRQLERYAKHNQVDAIILLTATAMHLPELIENKPAFVSSLGAGWL
ncbi:hypothetical protein [Rheinheimera sp.]|uniref:hypothetical protein n=1 Tax=Rheinheimera sp. TaxID=1869214 RepID=UPI004047D12A